MITYEYLILVLQKVLLWHNDPYPLHAFVSSIFVVTSLGGCVSAACFLRSRAFCCLRACGVGGAHACMFCVCCFGVFFVPVGPADAPPVRSSLCCTLLSCIPFPPLFFFSSPLFFVIGCICPYVMVG